MIFEGFAANELLPARAGKAVKLRTAKTPTSESRDCLKIRGRVFISQLFIRIVLERRSRRFRDCTGHLHSGACMEGISWRIVGSFGLA